MSQGPRTRVRLDGQVFRVVRSSHGAAVYQRAADKSFELIFNSRTTQNGSPLIARILEAERQARAHDKVRA